MSFNAIDQPISEVFNKTEFVIPRNQRRYVWGKINWQELMEDIVISSNNSINPHFFGSIVLKDNGKTDGISNYTIIDGQQRLTTLTIVLLAIMKLFAEQNSTNDFLGTVDYVQPKNNRNQPICILQSEYHQSLTKLINETIQLESGDKTSISAFVDSNILSKSRDKAIGNALKYFYAEIKKETDGSDTPNETLLRIRNAVINMILVKIVCSTEEDSYTIFEILNARGQELEPHELLKNYIMRYIQPIDRRDDAKVKWEELESKLGPFIKKFISHYVIHRFGNNENKETDYRIIKTQTKGGNINELLDDIKLKSEYYLKFISPQKDGEDANCEKYEYEIFNFFKSKRQEQFRPIILSLIHQKEIGKLTEGLYKQTLRFIYNFYVCYNIIGEERSNNLQDIVKKYAPILEDDFNKANLELFARSLKGKIPSLTWFESSFDNLGWSNHSEMFRGEKNKTRVQITLEIIEKFVSQRNDIGEFTIEHVLPDSYGEENAHIGNLIPLEDALNQRCSTKSLQDKYAIYSGSTFKTAQNFAERYNTKEFKPKDRTLFLARLIYNNILALNQFDFKNDV